MMRLKLSEFVVGSYVETWLRTAQGRCYLTHNAKWAVNQASINQTDVANTPIPLPPLTEQHRIVAEVECRLSVIDQMESVVEANLKRAERLRQAILKRAFEGKLVGQEMEELGRHSLPELAQGKERTNG
jgi:type I restriction enzyme, S subunit